ncbi:MAG TPA: DNA methyltransferase, partial [Armatimonadota bacterium]|nr:DNA methyltransferase [Armatimonadota bacterium]
MQSIGAAGNDSPLFPRGRNRLINGDCLVVMRTLPAETFDVIYLDPPSFSGKDFHLHNGEPGSVYSFTDIWEEGLQQYLDWLEERLAEMIRLLQPEGTLFVHLDWHAVHYVKVMLDRLLGYKNFQNEFIWYYSGGGASTQRFARKHDTILYYTKSATRWKFYADRVRVPHKWTRGQRRADGSPRDYAKGKLPDDVWQHHALMPWAAESLGYPTQKPEALLQRLLLATTDEGDIVGDFFCGGGTTAAMAQKLGRRWVTADISRISICLAAERIAELLVPGCIPRHEQRSRAQARARFAEIMADDTRLGLDAEAEKACTACAKIGFDIEQPHNC